MNAWRMSFRAGNQGPEMWPQCFRLHIAAITYSPLARTDLSKYAPGEPEELWAQLAPSQKASLRRLAYEMREGDVIFVKQGPAIVGRGTITQSYRFDKSLSLQDPFGTPWSHQVKVAWQRSFPETRILLGAEQLTVKRLSSRDAQRLDRLAANAEQVLRQVEAIEGDTFVSEATFRRRNRALINAKKANSDFTCEVCGLSFEEKYGKMGARYIIAHHTHPVSAGPTTTTLEDISLVCANCHAMLHTITPPLSLEYLRSAIVRSSHRSRS